MTETRKRKLIEVALPLEVINRESAREKSIRHGHPSTLHLWWSRKPLAAVRAVLFAQLVDDPSSHPDRFPTEEAQAQERRRLFDLIERLVVWENASDEALLAQARAEIWASCDGNPPPILDPFAGGGSIPLEAQRLGLEARASDLNPVAVLINKAMIEIPSKWTGRPPVFPGAASERAFWSGSAGLAEDVRRYGKWMHDEAERRIGHLYPKAKLPDGSKATVIAWIWARTVRCPNPACGITMPLVRSWWLGKKKGKESYIIPTVVDRQVVFSIGHDAAKAPTKDNDGTVTRTGAVCIACADAVPLAYIRAEGKSGRLGSQLMAIAAEGDRRRIYVAPESEHIAAADVGRPTDAPDTKIPNNPRYLTAPNYGMTSHLDLFTNRQLVALVTFSDLVKDAHERLRLDALAVGMVAGVPLQSGGTGAVAYADSIATYLAFAVSKTADNSAQLCTWMADAGKEGIAHVFVRQAIPMVWGYAEGSFLYEGPNDPGQACWWLGKAIDAIAVSKAGFASQADARNIEPRGALVSTDPPYYDNIPYADLSDFFYIWLRRSLQKIHTDVVSTVLTPKDEELVADPVRHGDRAEQFFEQGFRQVFDRIREGSPAEFPIAVFYAFKQSEIDADGEVSTGWEKLLGALIGAGWAVTATWPMRTERIGRLRDIGSNALASSVVLACRPRDASAGTTDRRGLIAALRTELPNALKELQQGSVAPVDLAQAAIGPGMAIFSRFATIAEPDGSVMRIRTALGLINQVLAEVLTEQEGDLDPDSRFALKWFEQFGWDEGTFGDAETLAKAMVTSIDGLERSGIFRARAGRARLIQPGALGMSYDPTTDDRISVWETMLYLIKQMEEHGIDAAGGFMARAKDVVDLEAVKELAYLLYSICERRRWAQQALRFNNLVTSWLDVDHVARRAPAASGSTSQGSLFDDLPADGEV